MAADQHRVGSGHGQAVADGVRIFSGQGQAVAEAERLAAGDFGVAVAEHDRTHAGDGVAAAEDHDVVGGRFVVTAADEYAASGGVQVIDAAEVGLGTVVHVADAGNNRRFPGIHIAQAGNRSVIGNIDADAALHRCAAPGVEVVVSCGQAGFVSLPRGGGKHQKRRIVGGGEFGDGSRQRQGGGQHDGSGGGVDGFDGRGLRRSVVAFADMHIDDGSGGSGGKRFTGRQRQRQGAVVRSVPGDPVRGAARHVVETGHLRLFRQRNVVFSEAAALKFLVFRDCGVFDSQRADLFGLERGDLVVFPVSGAEDQSAENGIFDVHDFRFGRYAAAGVERSVDGAGNQPAGGFDGCHV